MMDDDDTIPAREISITVSQHGDDDNNQTSSLTTGMGDTRLCSHEPLILNGNSTGAGIKTTDPARGTVRQYNGGKDGSIMSVGWGATDQVEGKMPREFVEGLENEDLWLLLRRFNKHVFHIKATTKPLPDGEVDFNTAPNEDFTSNKLRAQLERLYMGIIIGMLGFLQQFARLRSWRDPKRTAVFCIVYFTSWTLNFLLPTIFAALAGLILYPRLRTIMFPPAPRSVVDFLTGDISPNPPSGILATTDSATGAPEAHKGETLENEASNFAASIVGTAMNVLNDVVEPGQPERHDMDEDGECIAYHYFHDDATAVEIATAGVAGGRKGSAVVPGKQRNGDDDKKTKKKNKDRKVAKPSMLEPHQLATKVAVAKDKAAGVDRPSKDKSKVPIQKIIWRATRVMTHQLGEMSDYWERCENLLNPKLPFSPNAGRIRVASMALTLCAITALFSAQTLCKLTGFLLGVLIFGRPLLLRIQAHLVANNITIRTTIFHNIPTDAQQTITLLRMGEASRAPIPPPPSSNAQDLPHEDSTSHVNNNNNTNTKNNKQQVDDEDRVLADPQTHGKLLGRVFRVLKLGVKGTAKTVIAADAVRGKVLGTRSAKLRLGCADDDHDENKLIGPVEFKARYEGKKGFVYLTTDSDCGIGGERLCFARSRGVSERMLVADDGDDDDDDDQHNEDETDDGADDGDTSTRATAGDSNHNTTRHTQELVFGHLHPLWSIPVNEIAELNKFSGYGEKAKVLAGWALETAVKDGLQVIDRSGEIRLVTAMPKRDELFNRLCSMGGQRWEIW